VVPAIIVKGSNWFSSLGCPGSAGTKVFSLVGNVNRVGLIEIPLGTSLYEIVHDIGGGIPGGAACKAVQTGGPSGGCIPVHLLQLPVDYSSLEQAGSIMGSGGLIVMDDKTCMVDIARYFIGFLEAESCGKCTPCRVGLRRMREILDDISTGNGTVEDLAQLEHMASLIQQSALCGLGSTAPNVILSTLKHFKDEYLAHILVKKCPAGVCRELISFSIDRKKCTGCGACRQACPAGAIAGTKKKPHVIDQKKCTKCGACRQVCRYESVVVS
jgi:NADH:ubiquinone oxidoreductase subunit F (NADH-binding)/ferredoxin